MTEFPVGSPLPGTMGSGRREVLTVAQLLSRVSSGRGASYTPVARESATIAAQFVSVGSLLRREGRAPHAQDRPLQPRAIRQAEYAGATGAWPARPTSGRRRATAVAGALVAAGSVLGAALYNGAASHSSDAQAAADGLFPGLGLPTGTANTGLPDGLPAGERGADQPAARSGGALAGHHGLGEVGVPRRRRCARSVRRERSARGRDVGPVLPRQRCPGRTHRGRRRACPRIVVRRRLRRRVRRRPAHGHRVRRRWRSAPGPARASPGIRWWWRRAVTRSATCWIRSSTPVAVVVAASTSGAPAAGGGSAARAGP